MNLRPLCPDQCNGIPGHYAHLGPITDNYGNEVYKPLGPHETLIAIEWDDRALTTEWEIRCEQPS